MPLSNRLVAVTLLSFSLAGALPAAANADSTRPGGSVGGQVFDATGAAVPGASVSLRVAGGRPIIAVTDSAGQFTFPDVPAGPARVAVSLDGFAPAAVEIPASSQRPSLRFVLQPRPVSEQVTVRAEVPVLQTAAATKTPVPLRDVPQAATIVTREAIAAQGMQNLADLVRYVPGVGMAQGEGNRDAAIFRGNNSTADFFVDGVRDDVQYFRDLYNVERVEVLKGANGMTFGRGGAGGVLNRVTREATWSRVRDVTMQVGSFDNRRATLDVGQAVTRRVAGRVAAVYENSGSYRAGVDLERYGINPTMTATLGTRTVLTVGYEHFYDRRTADRGIPSYQGVPVAVAPSVFFGDPAESTSRATVNSLSATLQTNLSTTFVVRNHTRFADYDKFYQNVYPGSVIADGTRVSISAYNNTTTRRNLFNQTDVTGTVATGPVTHALLVGAEVGRQSTGNVRLTGYFGPGNATTVMAPVGSPTVSTPAAYRQSATDADNSGIATVRALYVQDQAALTRTVRVVAGLRYEVFEMDFDNHRAATTVRTVDHLVSPRLGLIVKPIEQLSLYSSYSLAHAPRAGEQLSSLTLSTQSLAPEQFRNYEVGAKWELQSGLFATAAVYQLDRRNVAVPDPNDPARSLLLNGQRTRGVEVEVNGRIAPGWQLFGGYAFQRAEVTKSLSATARAGARLAQVPAHTFSLWTQCDLTRRVGAGLGIVRRADMFTSTDNSVMLPAFTRVDAALYVRLNRRLRVQANVENVFDRRYFASAHSNTNITPGSPRAARVVTTASF